MCFNETTNHQGGWIMSELRRLEELERIDKKVSSVSGLVEMMVSPKHFYSKYVLKEGKSTKAMDDGTMIHKAVLEPESFHEMYAVLEPKEKFMQTKEDLQQFITLNGVAPSKGKKEELINQALAIDPEAKIWDIYFQKMTSTGKLVISSDEYTKCERIIKEVESHEWLKRLPANRQNEVAGYFTHPSGAIITFRLDCLFFGKNGRPVIIDLKKTTDASPEAFAKQIWNNKLFVQAACYVDAIKDITGIEPLYCWVVVEDKAPYCVEVYSADDGMLSAGHNVYNKMLNKFIECKETGIWPSYTNGHVNPIALPHWAFGKLDEFADSELYFSQEREQA
jgi:hypothetical protein